MSDNDKSTDNISAIDKAIAAAKARKAMKANGTEATATAKPAKAAKPAKEAKEPKKAKATDEEKAAKLAAKEAERVVKKAERDAVRAAKKAEKEAARKSPHMSKVEKAAAKLPALSASASATFDEITANFTAAEISTLAAHLTHFNRVKATERALGQKLEAGDTVTIVSGDARFIGQTGTVTKAQRIRCYVEVAGAKKPVYLFTSDVELVASEVEAETKSA